MKGDKRAPDHQAVSLDGCKPLVVPVVSAAGGVGRSTVAAQLAVALHQRTTDSRNRAVAVCDCLPAVRVALAWLARPHRRTRHQLARRRRCCTIPTSSSARSRAAPPRSTCRPASRCGCSPTPARWRHRSPALILGRAAWEQVLRYVRVAVIDADPLEGFRLARQQAEGRLSTAAAWMARPSARTAAVWVTDSSPSGMARTLEAMTVAESCGLSMRQVVVAINDCRGYGWMPRSRSRRMLLADRVGAIVELGHDAALRRDDWPCRRPEQLSRRDVAALVTAVLTAAESPAVSPRSAPVRLKIRHPLKGVRCMSLLPHALSQLSASAHYLAGPIRAHAIAAGAGNIPNPPPRSPGPGGGAIATLLAWTKWLALAACAASAVAAGGMIAVGNVTRRAEPRRPGQDGSAVVGRRRRGGCHRHPAREPRLQARMIKMARSTSNSRERGTVSRPP